MEVISSVDEVSNGEVLKKKSRSEEDACRRVVKTRNDTRIRRILRASGLLYCREETTHSKGSNWCDVSKLLPNQQTLFP